MAVPPHLREFSRRAPRKTRRLHPCCEGLEGRVVPAVFNVNSTMDLLNPPTGVVTLRSAIEAANKTSGVDDTINLTVGGNYSLSASAAMEDANATGDLDLLPNGGTLTIRNTSNKVVDVTGGGSDRVFDINPAAATTPYRVVMQGIVIQDGSVPGKGNSVEGYGGGIRATAPFNLVLNGVTLANNKAISGGGLGVLNPSGAAWSLSATDSTIEENTAGAGGGIYMNTAGGSGTGGNVSLTNCEIEENTATASGGGGIVASSATVTLTNCSLSANTASGATGGGGGLVVSSGQTTVNIERCYISGDEATSTSGGAIEENAGNLAIADSLFTNGTAGAEGGAIVAGFNALSLTIDRSTFTSDNATTNGGALALNTIADPVITNCTFFSNNAKVNGGAVSMTYDASFVNCTITSNQAAKGGGIWFDHPVTLLNTILAENFGTQGQDIFGNAASYPVKDLGGNLLTQVPAGYGFSAGTFSGDPETSSVLYNGGPYVGVAADTSINVEDGYELWTLALRPGSPAISRGIANGAPSIDTRGFTRPGSGLSTPTIGSYEPQSAFVPTQTFVVGGDGQVYGRKTDNSGTPTGGYYLTAPGGVYGLAVGRFGVSGTMVFVIGTDGQAYAQNIDVSNNHFGSYHNGYFAMAPGRVKAIAAGTDAHDEPLLFAVGLDDQLYEQTFDQLGDRVGGYQPTAFGSIRSVVVTHDANGNPLLYATGTDGQVYGLKMDQYGDVQGGYFKVASGGVKSISVTADASKHPEIFVQGLDNGVYGVKTDATGSPVGGYFNVSNGEATSIAATHDALGKPILFVVGLDGRVYGEKFDSNGTPVGGFYATGAGQVNSIVAGTDGQGRPEILGIAPSDGQVYEQLFDPAGNPPKGYTLYGIGSVYVIAAK